MFLAASHFCSRPVIGVADRRYVACGMAAGWEAVARGESDFLSSRALPFLDEDFKEARVFNGYVSKKNAGRTSEALSRQANFVRSSWGSGH